MRQSEPPVFYLVGNTQPLKEAWVYHFLLEFYHSESIDVWTQERTSAKN